MIRSARSGLSGDSRDAGTPPSTPFAASFSITSAPLARHADGELVEERVVEHAHARHLGQHVGQLHRVGVIDARQPPQARLAQQAHVDRERQHAQAGVGADVGGGLLAADVLLARRQRQHEAAPALLVHRLAAQPARHLPHKLLPRGEQARRRARRTTARCRSTAPRPRRCRRPWRPAARTSPSDTTSVNTAISSAPAACAASASGVRSRTWPKKSGFCTTTHDTVGVDERRSGPPPRHAAAAPRSRGPPAAPPSRWSRDSADAGCR